MNRFFIIPWLALFTPVAFSATTPRFAENFESTALDQLPPDWSVEDATAPGGPAAWRQWAVKDFNAFRAEGGPRDSLSAELSGRGPVADSDLYGTFNYDSSLLTPSIAVDPGDILALRFQSGYRHNSNQRADFEYRWDGGSWISLLAWSDGDGVHRDEQDDDRPIIVLVTNTAAASIQLRWRLRENYGWYWAIDDVRVDAVHPSSQPPDRPSALSPPDGATDVAFLPVLQGSAFSDPDAGDLMGAAQWQVVLAGGDFAEPHYDSGPRLGEATTFELPSAVLAPGGAYAWRVRYRDLGGQWSEWSDPARFTVQTREGLYFTNIQPASGVTKVSSRGGAWLDYDNDGFQDLWTGSTIYRNQEGSGLFEEITTLPNPTSGPKAGTACADFNNDGWTDIFVGSQWLYENLAGTGSFQLRSTESGLSGNFPSQAVCWGDMDQDGWVDVYVVGDSGAEGALYRNLGGTRFTNITAVAGVSDPLEGYGAAWADADNDGDLDLFVANCASQNPWDSYFENQGNGTFIQRADQVGVRGNDNSWASAWGDYDNDLDLDLYVVSTSSPDHFFRNDGGVFTDLTGQPGLPNGSDREAVWADFDHDGDLDLYLCRISGENLLYRNDGGDQFVNIAPETGSNDAGSGRVAAVADMDNDGDLDMFIGNSGGTPVLYRNELGASQWLIVRLHGTASNRSAVGARVYAATPGLVQMREVSGGGGLYTQLMLPVHFGLGAATKVTQLRILWPSGLEQILPDVPSNQILDITEPWPALSIAREDNQARLTWPVVRPFELQSKSSLLEADWNPVPPSPELINGTTVLQLPLDSSSRFFRLRRQDDF